MINIHTSILRPSIIAPCNFSRAASASSVDANVTKPKPLKEKTKIQSIGISSTDESGYSIFAHNT
jgi:hypothetical protein